MAQAKPTGAPHSDSSSAASVSRNHRLTGLPESLTTRELEVLELIASGLHNNQISDRLAISIGTVERHTTNIYGKLGVETRTQAILRAGDLQLIGQSTR